MRYIYYPKLYRKIKIQRGVIVIPKSSNPIRQKENFNVWDFEMSEEEINSLESLNRNLRYVVYEQ